MTQQAQAVVQTQQATPATSSVKGAILQRKCACGQHTVSGGECEECRKKNQGGMLQRAAVSPSSARSVPPIVHDVLSSSGQPLDAGTRAFMEPRFGHDFSQVRVHTDARAAESAHAVNALAYTVGRSVVFGAGEYTPGTSEGRRLLAHELTHVVQQRFDYAGTISGFSGSTNRESLELEAETTARDVAIIGRVQQSFSHTTPGLFFLRTLGHITYADPFFHISGSVVIQARTVEEWRTFLREKADTEEGSIELNAFMALALGQKTALTGISMSQSFDAEPPTKEEAIDLMVAFLTVGQDIDLPDKFWEGLGEAKSWMGNLMADFNVQFAPLALQRLSGSQEFRLEDVQNVSSYAQAAADIKVERYPGGVQEAKDPVASLLAAALATAFTTTVEIIKLGSKPESQSLKRQKYLQLRNSAMTIRGVIDHLEDVDTQKVAAMNGAFNAAAAAAPEAGQMISWGLAGLASTFFQSLLAGDIRDKVRKLKDDFRRTIQGIGDSENVDADTLEIIKTDFETALNY